MAMRPTVRIAASRRRLLTDVSRKSTVARLQGGHAAAPVDRLITKEDGAEIGA